MSQSNVGRKLLYFPCSVWNVCAPKVTGSSFWEIQSILVGTFNRPVDVTSVFS